MARSCDSSIDNRPRLSYDSAPLKTEVDQAGPATALVFNLKKDSPFSFKCQVCSVCCSNKAIRLGPYEALRLARSLKISTTELYRIYAEEGGTVLRNKPDGSCIFLNSRGCGVHPDRPLVCRLFPLGQLGDGQDSDKLGIMPLHPDCLGLVDTDGTVGSYLESQGAGAYFQYDQVYSAIYKRIRERLPCLQAADPEENRRGAFAPGGLLSPWLDIDAGVAAYGRRQKSEKPENLDELIRLHIQAMEDWIAGL